MTKLPLLLFEEQGGICKNINFGVGPNGRGLFKALRDKESLLYLPKSLVFSASDVGYNGDQLFLSEHSSYTDSQRYFFDSYYNKLSFQLPDEKSSVADLWYFFYGLEKDLRWLLEYKFGKRLINRASEVEGILALFRSTRCINAFGGLMFMPIVELINHSPTGKNYRIMNQGLDCGMAKTQKPGICFYQNRGGNELLANYSPKLDSLSLFCKYGFFSKEPRIYSVPLVLNLDSIVLHIEGRRDYHDTGLLSKNNNVTYAGKRLTIKSLLLYSASEALSAGEVFVSCIKHYNIGFESEMWDKILKANVSFLNQIKRYCLDIRYSKTALELRKAIEYESYLLCD